MLWMLADICPHALITLRKKTPYPIDICKFLKVNTCTSPSVPLYCVLSRTTCMSGYYRPSCILPSRVYNNRSALRVVVVYLLESGLALVVVTLGVLPDIHVHILKLEQTDQTCKQFSKHKIEGRRKVVWVYYTHVQKNNKKNT